MAITVRADQVQELKLTFLMLGLIDIVDRNGHAVWKITEIGKQTLISLHTVS